MGVTVDRWEGGVTVDRWEGGVTVDRWEGGGDSRPVGGWG